MTERYTESVSNEPLEIIQVNECNYHLGTSLCTQRFRRLFNEIVDLREQLDAARRTTTDREAWISVDERLPEEGQDVAFVVQADKGSIQDYLNGRVLGGSFMTVGGYPTFTVPGVGFKASHWMPLPTAPNGEKK